MDASFGRFSARACAVAAVLLLAACDHFDRPDRPLPPSFSATTLDGRPLRAADLRGKPWVINLWVPG